MSREPQIVDALGIELRFVFVEMLFALTIAEVATQVATLAADGLGITQAPSSYSHLFLAIIVVAASWIGWKNSEAAGNKLPVEEIFSLGFWVLLLDVALVIFYFILVRGAEKSINGVVTPSVANETKWILIIFIGYFVWDVLTKAVPHVEHKSLRKRLFGQELWGRGWISFTCVALAVLIWFVSRGVSTQAGVVLTDVSLIALALLFRSLKQWATWWKKKKTGDPAAEAGLTRSKRWTAACAIILIASVGVLAGE
jgi:hypothetical protein